MYQLFVHLLLFMNEEIIIVLVCTTETLVGECIENRNTDVAL